MNFKNKQAIFFDMDGTLVDSETLYFQTRRDTLAKYGFKFTKEDNAPYLARGFADTLHRLQRLVGDDDLGKKILDESLAKYQEEVENGALKLKPGCKELLSFLKENDFKSYITSSSGMDKIHYNLQKVGIEDYFTDIISGSHVKNNKPAPDIYLYALKVAGVDKQDAVIFEDATNGMLSGLNAGIDVIAVPDQVMPPKEVADRVTMIKDLKQAINLFK